MEFIFLAINNFYIGLKNSKETLFKKALIVIIYLGIFLIPLFNFPLFQEKLYEYGRVLLFILFIIIALLIWLIKIYISREINISSYFLDPPIVLFVFVYFLASIFSIDLYRSLIGSGLIISFSFISILFLTFFYFFVSRYISTLRQIINIYYFLLAAFFLISLSTLINLLPITPPRFLVGISVSDFGLVLLLGFFICLLLILLSKTKTNRIILGLMMMYFFIYLIFLDKQQILLILILSIFLFIVLLSLKAEKFSEKLVIALTLLLFVSVLAAILPINKVTGLISVNELSLPNNFSWEITSATLADNLILGAGPQNFLYSFYKYKPVGFNLTNLWQVGFARSSNFWMEILNNIGLLGIVLFLIVVFKYYLEFFKNVKRLIILDEFTYKKYLYNCGLAVILFSLIIFGIFHNYTFVTMFLLFLFLGLGASSLQAIKIEKIFADRNMIFLGFYIFLIILICFSYLGARYFLADIYMAQASTLTFTDENSFKKGEIYLQRSLKLNRNQADFNIKLARLYLNQVIFWQNKQQPINDSGIWDKINNNLQLAQRKNINYNNYVEIFQIYNTLKGFGVRVVDEQKEINSKLLELNNNNPELYIDRALLSFDDYLLIKAGKSTSPDQEIQIEVLKQKIKVDLEASIDLKENYALGYYNLGLYYQEIGEENNTFENIKKAFDLDPRQLFITDSLKRLYLNQDKTQEAMEVLNKYLEYNPADTQTRIELAEMYRNNNMIEKAKEQASIVLENEPDNEKAKEFLK